MGGTLAAAAAKSGLGIAVSDKSAEKAEELAQFGIYSFRRKASDAEGCSHGDFPYCKRKV